MLRLHVISVLPTLPPSLTSIVAHTSLPFQIQRRDNHSPSPGSLEFPLHPSFAPNPIRYPCGIPLAAHGIPTPHRSSLHCHCRPCRIRCLAGIHRLQNPAKFPSCSLSTPSLTSLPLPKFSLQNPIPYQRKLFPSPSPRSSPLLPRRPLFFPLTTPLVPLSLLCLRSSFPHNPLSSLLLPNPDRRTVEIPPRAPANSRPPSNTRTLLSANYQHPHPVSQLHDHLRMWIERISPYSSSRVSPSHPESTPLIGTPACT